MNIGAHGSECKEHLLLDGCVLLQHAIVCMIILYYKQVANLPNLNL